MTFHDTIGLDPDSLRVAIVQAKRQEDAVLAIFTRLQRPLTPSEVHGMIVQARSHQGLPAPPITSIRRALTNLAHDDGAPLVKTDTQRKGLYHLPEHAWALATPIEQTMPQPCAMTGA